MTLFQPSTDVGVGEAFCTSGTSPTPGSSVSVHLVGPGSVGQAFLRLLPKNAFRLIGITDRSATVCDRSGLAADRLAELKRTGGSLSQLDGAEALPVELALDLTQADIVVDATPTGIDNASAHAAARRNLRVLRRGGSLALAAKDTLCLEATELLAPEYRERVGIHAVLGGTGRALLADLDELRRDCDEIAIVGNASTTAVLAAIERGETVDQGIRRAQTAGVLEPDPELDLSGRDAAVKLVSVASALWGGRRRVADVIATDLREVAAASIRGAHRDGQTTRLVARGRRGGLLRVGYETLSRTSALAVPATHVAYTYALRGGQTRVHVGHGIGPAHTASALFQDVRALAAAGRVS